MWIGHTFIPNEIIGRKCESLDEECGLLLGKRRGLYLYVKQLVLVPNHHPDPANKFRINFSDAYPYLPFVIGIWHTHPLEDTIPSGNDLQNFVESKGRFKIGLITNDAEATLYDHRGDYFTITKEHRRNERNRNRQANTHH